MDTVAAVIHSYSITPELQYNSVYQKNFFFYSALQQQSQLLTVQFVRGTSELRELDLPCKKHEYIKYKIHYNTAYFDAKKCMFFQFEVMTSQTLDSFNGRDAKRKKINHLLG